MNLRVKNHTAYKTSAISTTALTLVGLAFNPVAAQAAETEPTIKVDAVKTFDGTGYDNKSTQCVIRSENNFPGLTDENSSDNNVCSSDTVGVRIDFDVPAKAQEQKFTIDLKPRGGLRINQSTLDTWKAWCETFDPTRSGVDSSNNSILSCTFTVAANTSSIGTIQLAFLADSTIGKTGSIDMTVIKDGSTTTQNLGNVNILSTFQRDFGIRQVGSSEVQTIDGVEGRVFNYRVVGQSGDRWSDFASVKGLRSVYDVLDTTVRIDTSKLTSGARVLPNALFADVNGVPAFTGETKLSSQYAASGNLAVVTSNDQPLEFKVFVPKSAPENFMTIGLGDVDVSSSDPNFTHPLNYGVGEQPGNNVGSTEVSDKTTPAIFQSNILGPNPASNSSDWARMDLKDNLAFKQLRADENGTVGKVLIGPGADGTWDPRWDGIRPGDKYWTGADVPAEQREGDISFCDAWQTSPSDVSRKYAPQFYDQSRQPVVQAFRNGKWVDIPFTQQYRKTDAGMDCARPNDDDGWSNTGTSIVDDSTNSFNATRVRISADDHKNERVRVYFPFTTPSAGAVDGYPNWYVVNDNITYTSAASVDAVYPAAKRLSYYLTGVGVNNFATVSTSEVAFAGQVIPSTVSMETWPYFSHFREGDNTKVEQTVVIDYSPCVTPRFDQRDIDELKSKGSKVVIREADLGADGFACTDDDGLPAQVTITRDQYDAQGYYNNEELKASLFISPFAKAGTTINPVKATQSFRDPDGLVYFRPSVSTDVKSTSIQGGVSVAQSNFQTKDFEKIGNRVGWVSNIFNTTDTEYGRSTFINVLPNESDSRETQSRGQLNDVKITASDNIRPYVKVTTADPGTISRNARTAADDPNIKWCSLDDNACLEGKEITAYIIDMPNFPAKMVGEVRVDADTDNMTSGGLVNDLGDATVNGLEQNIRNTNDVVTTLVGLSFVITSTLDTDNDGSHDLYLGNVPYVLVSPSGKEYKGRTRDGFEISEVKPEEGTWTLVPDPNFAGFTLSEQYSGPLTFEIGPDDTRGDFTLLYQGERPTPEAVNDSRVTEMDTPIEIRPLDNDKSATGWYAGGYIYLIDQDGNETDSVKVDGGTYSVVFGMLDETTYDMKILFTPDPGFTGSAPPVTYGTYDSFLTEVRAQVNVDVVPVAGPTSVDDNESTPYNTPVTIDALGNDNASSDQDPLDLETFALLDADGNQVKELTTTEGVWSIVDGKVNFVPADGYTGTTAPVRYRVADTVGGQSTESSITVTVAPRPNVVPSAVDDSSTTPKGKTVTVNVLGNDAAGADYDPIVKGSVKLRDADGNPVDTLTTADGTYRVVDDQIEFTPNADFVGVTQPVTYELADSNGDKATATVIVTVTDVPKPVYKPTAVDDFAKTKPSTPVQIDLIANDKAGDESDPIEDESIAFLDADGNRVERLTTSEGVYEIVEKSVIQFTPAEGFTGRTKPVPYQIVDSTGDVATANIVIEVEEPKPANVVPTANDDQGRTKQGEAITLDLLANDVSGSDSDLIDPSKTRLVNANGNLVTRIELTEGVFELGTDGKVKFTPADGFSGIVPPVRYRVVDSNGDTSVATIRIVVDPVSKPPVVSKPLARNDIKMGKKGKPVTLDVLANDTASKNAMFKASSLRLVNKNGDPVTKLVVKGEGVWTVNDGRLVFTPTKDFTGITTAVPYTVLDSTGQRMNALATVIIKGTPSKPSTSPKPIKMKVVKAGPAPRKANTDMPSKVEVKSTKKADGIVSSPKNRQVVIHTGVVKEGKANGGNSMYPVLAGGVGGLSLLGLLVAASRSRRNRSTDARNN